MNHFLNPLGKDMALLDAKIVIVELDQWENVLVVKLMNVDGRGVEASDSRDNLKWVEVRDGWGEQGIS